MAIFENCDNSCLFLFLWVIAIRKSKNNVQKIKFSLRISSIYVNKSAGNCSELKKKKFFLNNFLIRPINVSVKRGAKAKIRK